MDTLRKTEFGRLAARVRGARSMYTVLMARGMCGVDNVYTVPASVRI